MAVVSRARRAWVLAEKTDRVGTRRGAAPYDGRVSAAPDESLVTALASALRANYQALRAAHPDHRLYAFGLYITRDALFIGPTAASEEGLRGRDDPESYRWRLSSSPLHLFEEDTFDPVQTLLASRPDPYELDEDEMAAEVGTRLESCFAALETLDREGLFGAGTDRDGLVVSIFSADESDRLRLDHAKRLNPPTALAVLEPALAIREPVGDPQLLGEHQTYQVASLDYRDGVLVAAATSGELYGWRVTPEGFEELFCLKDEDEHWAVLLEEGSVLYGSTGGIRRRALDALEEPAVVLEREAKVTQLAAAPDRAMVVADEAYEHLVALAPDGKVLWERELGGRPLAFAPDGSSLAAAGHNGECVSLLDPTSGSEHAVVACGGTTAAAFADAGVVAVANRAGVHVHAKAEGWASVRSWPIEVAANALAFSPSGTHLAGVFDDGLLRVWSMATGGTVLEVNGRQESLLDLAWLDETRIAAGGRDPDRGAPVYVWTLPG